MSTQGSTKGLPATLLFMAWAFVISPAHADVLVEWLFWNEMGNQVGRAVQSHEDYRRERQLWRDKIAAARGELERCGGCASAQAELDKWQDIENQFQEVAGAMAQSVAMPPVVAKWLGIDMPMARGRTREEIENSKEVNRPEWYSDRPEFCQAAVDRYLECQRDLRQETMLGWSDADRIGGRCHASWKLFRHCAYEDYAAFGRESKFQQMRRDGAILAEIDASSPGMVHYGQVPDDFTPGFPPYEVASAAIDDTESFPRGITFVFQKSGQGRLSGFHIGRFRDDMVAPGNPCQSVDRNKNNEMENRICGDLLGIKYGFKSLVIVCGYSKGPGARRKNDNDYFTYWYGSSPTVVDDEYLLERSRDHPILLINEPRTSCPATMDEASRIDAAYKANLEGLRAEIPQISPTVSLPTPSWQTEAFERIEREGRQRAAERQELESALRSHFRNSRLELNFATGDDEFAGICSSVPQGADNYLWGCRAEGELRTGQVSIGGYPMRLSLQWHNRPLRQRYLRFEPDPLFAAGEEVLGLVRSGDESPGEGRIVRIDSLDSLRSLSISGEYDAEFSGPSSRVSGRCRISKMDDERSQVYPMTCSTDDNRTHEGTARISSDRLSGLSILLDWQMRIEDRVVGAVELAIDPAREIVSTESVAFLGYSYNGVGVQLVKTGPIDQPSSDYSPVVERAGTPLEELPELARGSYAEWAHHKGVTSLEQLAALSDAEAQAIGVGWVWRRDLAREYLATHGSTAARAGGNPVDDTRTETHAGQIEPRSREGASRSVDAARGGEDDPRRAHASVAEPSSCRPTDVAGFYESSRGVMECQARGSRLECCYGGSCQRVVILKLGGGGHRMVGLWKELGGAAGPAEFDLTNSCALSEGRWGSDLRQPPQSEWQVARGE